MLLRPLLNDRGSCASHLFGCTSHGRLAVVDQRRPGKERIVALNGAGRVAAAA